MDLLLAMSKLQAGLYVFVMGFLVVFLGMGVIIAVVSIIGKIMDKANKSRAKKAEQASADSQVEVLPQVAEDSDEEARIRAAIVAVLTNYYFNQGSNCEFKIKKIRRI